MALSRIKPESEKQNESAEKHMFYWKQGILNCIQLAELPKERILTLAKEQEINFTTRTPEKAILSELFRKLLKGCSNDTNFNE